MSKKSKKSSTQSGSPDDPEEAGRWMYQTLATYGVDAEYLTKTMAFGMLRRLKAGQTPEEAALEMKLAKWTRVWPSSGQIGYMKALGLPHHRAKCKRQAGLILDAHLEPLKTYRKLYRQIDKTRTPTELDEIGRDVGLVLDVLPEDFREPLMDAGRRKRGEVGTTEIPE